MSDLSQAWGQGSTYKFTLHPLCPTPVVNMIKQKLINIFRRQIKRSAPITTNFILTNAITMQASINGGRLKIT